MTEMILDPENVLKLKKCRRELLSTLDYDLMAPALIQENILSTGEYQTLKTSPGGNIEKVREKPTDLSPRTKFLDIKYYLGNLGRFEENKIF